MDTYTQHMRTHQAAADVMIWAAAVAAGAQ
jgi:hypothetical protein